MKRSPSTGSLFAAGPDTPEPPCAAPCRARARRARLRGLAGLLVLLAGGLAAPAAANAARSEFFGVVQGQFNAKGQLDGRDLNGMAARGVHTNRFELGWKSVVPRQGTFNWAPSDRFIGALASRGIRA